MYDPYEDRRARRRYDRDMRRYNRYQNPMRGLAGGFFIIALLIAFVFHGSLGSIGILPLLFVGLALFSLFGTASTMNQRSIYGGMYGFVWMLGLALCFIIGFWPWILLPIAATMILGALFNPIMNGLGYITASQMQQQPPIYQQQQAYQHPEQPGYEPYQQGYQSYQQGYQGSPVQSQTTYQEGGQRYPYNQGPKQQYEQPQVQYPEQQQELPPMEQ